MGFNYTLSGISHKPYENKALIELITPEEGD